MAVFFLCYLGCGRKNKDMQNIPENVVAAAVGLLSPFVRDLTPETLQKKLSADVIETDKASRTEYTRKEAAKRLGLNLRTIDNYLSSGTLKARKVGRRRVLIPADGIEALLSGEYGREVTA
jgi:excisionase family DNA binding protein